MPNKTPLALHQITALARGLVSMFDGKRPFLPSDKENIETLVRAIPDLVREIHDLHENSTRLSEEHLALIVKIEKIEAIMK